MPAFRRWRQKDQTHKAILGYERLCLKSSFPDKKNIPRLRACLGVVRP